MKTKLILLAFIIFASFMKAQNVYFPDPIFRDFMLSQYYINTNRDNEISVSEAQAFTGDLVASSNYFTDFTGIEAFINMTGFNCSSNQVTSLDVSGCKALKILYCVGTLIKSLDLSQNTALTNIYISNNPLLFNLNVTECKSLDLLSCYSNFSLKTLDVSKNTALTKLFCFDNQLTSLNLKNGKNSIMSTMQSYLNPDLACIQVDDANYANSANWQKDAASSYSTNCSLSVSDVNKKGVMIYPNPVKNTINFSEEVSNIKIIDNSGKMIRNRSASVKTIDVSQLEKGIYIINANTKSGKVITKKVVKE